MPRDMELINYTFPQGIKIAPIGDVHLGALEHSKADWENFLKSVEEDDLHLILVGDLLNNSTRGVKFANPFEEVMRPREAKRKMVEYLEPIKHRILCAVTGNHEERTSRESDQDLTYDICSKLDIEDVYRENVAFMVIRCGERREGDHTKPKLTYTFCITHGAFGGALTGGMINRNERFGAIIENLDCLITAHAHKGAVTKPQKIVIDARNNLVMVKHYVAIACVSWLNWGGYAARKMLTPAQVCDPQILRLSDNDHDKRIITTW